MTKSLMGIGIKRRIAAMILMIMIAVSFAFSYDVTYGYEAFDDDTPITLTAEFTGDAAGVSGIELKAYKVADMDSDANFEVTDAFSGYSVDFSAITDQSAWRTLGETLGAYIERDGILPSYIATTDENGTAQFGTVEPALYLIKGPSEYFVEEYIYSVDISMVTAPYLDGNGQWMNTVTFSPKYKRDTDPPPEIPETPGLKVIKIWEDGEESVSKPETRPNSIEVELICDGKVIDTVVLSDSNGWQHEWIVSADKTYSVTEKNVPNGYKVGIAREGNVVAITNTYTPPETPPEIPPTPSTPTAPKTPPTTTTTTPTPTVPKLPNTGLPWIPAIVLAIVGAMFLSVGIIRRRSAE